MNPKAEFYFNRKDNWQREINALRSIMLSSGLQEELKWGCPCYTTGGHNVALIHVFKEYCAVLFFKGALLNDPKGLLIQQTKNVQAARQMRFTGPDEVQKYTADLKKYLKQAIDVEKAGLKVTLKKTSEFPLPEEFRAELVKRAGLKKAFYALTPGRQRAYLLFFTSAKLPATRKSRIQKCIPGILSGRGLDD